MKLEDFANEMLTEIKDIKDLAKEELPLVAKEYVRYQTISNLMSIGFCLVVLLICAISTYITIGSANTNVQFVFGVGAVTSGIIGAVSLAICVDNYIYVKLQPRRVAIKAITTLINKE